MNNPHFNEYSRIYYQHMFPCNLIYRWLNYGSDNLFRYRDISSCSVQSRWSRFNFLQSAADFRKYLGSQALSRLDVGAIYNLRKTPEDTRLQKQAKQMELVFDIDINDYDPVRTCCNGAQVCELCWKFLAIACKIIDRTLRDDIGIKHILWVFSGRRGIHAWACDERVRRFDESQRMDILRIVTLFPDRNKKINLSGKKLTLSEERALQIIDEKFEQIMFHDQSLLVTEEGIKKFLALLPEGVDRDEIKKIFDKYDGAKERWESLVDYVNTVVKFEIPDCHVIEELKLRIFAPKLDEAVTKSLVHILKMPLSFHPTTMRIAIPFHVELVDTFDLATVPTVEMTVTNQFDPVDQEVRAKMSDRFRTATDILERFIEGLEKDVMEKKKKKDKAQKDAISKQYVHKCTKEHGAREPMVTIPDSKDTPSTSNDSFNGEGFKGFPDEPDLWEEMEID